MTVKEAALRFVLSHPDISSAIIGFGASEHVDEAVRLSKLAALPEDITAPLVNRYLEIKARHLL